MTCLFLFVATVASKQVSEMLGITSATAQTTAAGPGGPGGPGGVTQKDHTIVVGPEGQLVNIEDQKLDKDGCFFIDMKCDTAQRQTLLYLIFFTVLLIIIVGFVLSYQLGFIWNHS